MTSFTTRRKVLKGMGLSAFAIGVTAGCAQRFTETAAREGGSSDRPSEGGVGGTGIVGVVHDLGSLLVNGLRVEIPESVAARDAFGPLASERVGIGHSVTIEAAQTAEGALVARSLALVHPLMGPIDKVTAGGFECLGVSVDLEAGAILKGPDGDFALAPGQNVSVSGLWRDDSVVAARVDLRDPAATDVVVAGEVRAGTSAESRRLGGLVLVLPHGAEPPKVGSFATAIGQRVGAAFVVRTLVRDRFRGLAGPIQRLSIEGYLETAPQAPGYAVSGLGHSFDDAARLAELADGRALFVGPYDGDFRVSLGLPLPDEVARRRGLLAAVEDGFAPAEARSTR